MPIVLLFVPACSLYFNRKPPRDVDVELKEELDAFVQASLEEYAKLFLEPGADVRGNSPELQTQISWDGSGLKIQQHSHSSESVHRDGDGNRQPTTRRQG